MKKLCVAWMLLVSWSALAEPLVLSAGAPPDAPGVKLILDRERRALASLGFEVSYVNLPGDRNLVEANAGRTDGDAGRVDSVEIEAHYPDLLRVPVPVGVSTNRVYWKRDLPITGLDDLVVPGRKIVVYSGILWAMTVLKSMVPAEDFLAVPDYTQALRMLVTGRADVVVGFEPAVEGLLSVAEFAAVRKGPVVKAEPLYLYLHRKWANLIPRVAERLKQLSP